MENNLASFQRKRKIFIECGIFKGDSLSPTLFGLAFIIISYTIRQMKFGYIPGPPGNRNSNQMKTQVLGQKPPDINPPTENPQTKTPQSKIFVFHFLQIFMVSQVHNLLIVQWLPV